MMIQRCLGNHCSQDAHCSLLLSGGNTLHHSKCRGVAACVQGRVLCRGYYLYGSPAVQLRSPACVHTLSSPSPDTINSVTANGLTFAHPLQHLQKTRDVREGGRGEGRKRGREEERGGGGVKGERGGGRRREGEEG